MLQFFSGPGTGAKAGIGSDAGTGSDAGIQGYNCSGNSTKLCIL
jgi:hypothetical protein